MVKRQLKRIWFESYLDTALWNKAALARASGVTTTTLTAWTYGSSPSRSLIGKVVSALNSRYQRLGLKIIITIDDILLGNELDDQRQKEGIEDRKRQWERQKTNNERKSQMEAMSKSGMTRTAIAKEFGISRERVRQIMGNFKNTEKRICAVCGDEFSPMSTIAKWCSTKCYQLLKKYGGPKPEYSITRIPTITKHIAPPNDRGCWEWQGTVNPTTGYGSVVWEDKRISIHRLVWRIVFGEIPSGVFVCHTCDQPACCNPYHLFIGTARDNARDRDLKGRGHASTFLNKTQIDTIRTFYNSPADCQWLAKSFGVHPKTIYKIGKGVVHTGERRKQRSDKSKATRNYWAAKLTPVQVFRIRNLYSCGNHSYRSLAMMYHVKYAAIYKIIQMRSWKYI